MEEFAKMIYEQWRSENENQDVFGHKGEELTDKLQEILSIPLFNDIYEVFCKGCFEIEETAFIAGFGYAYECLSNGKIEIGGVKE